MSSQLPKASYETSVTHRRSTMRSRKWDAPEDLGDGCFTHHTPSVNEDCELHTTPPKVTVVPRDPAPTPPVEAPAVQITVEPATDNSAVLVSNSPAVIQGVVVTEPKESPRVFGQDFDGQAMTVADLYALAAQCRFAEVNPQATIRAWVGSDRVVTRIAAVE